MAFFPAAVATNANLYIAVNSLQTTLSTSLGTGDVSVVLASATGFPTAGAVTIDNEIIFYTGVSGATLTGCTRGADGTTAATHSSGVPVGATIVAFHHNGLKDEVIAIETYLNTKFGTSGSAYTASRALQTNSSTGIPEVSSVTNTELGYLSGVTSAIQTQFGLKAPLASPTFTGAVLIPDGSAATPGIAFSADTNTGMWRTAADIMWLGAGGNSCLRVNATDVLVNVGPLFLQNGTAANPSIAFDSDSDTGFFRQGANDIGVAAGGTLIGQFILGQIDLGQSPWTIEGSASGWYPATNNSIPLGFTSQKWTAVWAVNGTIQTSMANSKSNIRPLAGDPDFKCKVPMPALFNRPGETEEHIRLGWLADKLPDEAHPWTKDKKGNWFRDKDNVYTDSILAMHSLALRNDYDRLAALEEENASLKSQLTSIEARLLALEAK